MDHHILLIEEQRNKFRILSHHQNFQTKQTPRYGPFFLSEIQHTFEKNGVTLKVGGNAGTGRRFFSFLLIFHPPTDY